MTAALLPACKKFLLSFSSSIKTPPLASIVTAQIAKHTPEGATIIVKSDPAIKGKFLLVAEEVDLDKPSTFYSDVNAAKFLAINGGETMKSLVVEGIEQWLDFCSHGVEPSMIRSLDQHLMLRTFLVGHSLTLADIAVWASIVTSGTKLAGHPHASRWFAHLDSMEPFQTALLDAGVVKNPSGPAAGKGGPQGAPKVEKPASPQGKDGKGKGKDQANLENKLPGAEVGKVVTRFPPEPSGYLHIGHAKAALLNAHYARAYKGKLIVRFDDTNPSKEKDEFTESILKDLARLEIHADQVTHTSDYFEELAALCEQMIKHGQAYVDDTDVDTMRQQRADGVESASRSRSVEENLALWKEMWSGTEKGLTCCVRMKIGMKHKNKCMRDPVMYRCQVEFPHPRFGNKYKAYPTYDFCCPVVDSWEGVTHALRTIEYADRNEQYQWVINTLKLRPVSIYEFSRSNFMHTVLSKRKLAWFVNNEVVEGWHDPRMPTIQGVLRRGLTVDALKDFVLTQGASKATNLMSWDKIWAINKQKIDPVVPRYPAVDREGMVKLTFEDWPEEPQLVKEQLHPKDPSLGLKDMYKTKSILLEKADAELVEGEEVTFLHWGNAIITGKDGDVIKAKTNPEGSVKSTKKKIHWLPALDEEKLTPLNLVYLDNLITKEKPEDDDKIEDLVNKASRVETVSLGDPELAKLEEGTLMQLERKGYFIVDKKSSPSDRTVTLINIPDGRTKKK